MTTYRTFKRTANNFEEFASAKKVTVDTGLTIDEAREACKDFNDNRTSAQEGRGTMMEFINEG